MKRLNNSMLTGPLLPNIILYTIPIILTSLLQLLFNAADLMIVGRFCGSVSVAAVGATGAITNLMVNFFRRTFRWCRCHCCPCTGQPGRNSGS